MKTKVLIIEDCCYRFFTTKQLLESQLRLTIEVETAKSEEDLIQKTADFEPNILICHPRGGVIEILESLKRKGLNRRNAEITMVVSSEIHAELGLRIFAAAEKKPTKEFFTIARAA